MDRGKGEVTALVLDDSFNLLEDYSRLCLRFLDLRKEGLSRWCCRWERLLAVEERLHGEVSPFVLIGNNDYHYLTYVLLKRIKEPFTLVLFDNHSELCPAPGEELITCGSWLERALALPTLQGAVVVGAAAESFAGVAPVSAEKVVYVPPDGEEKEKWRRKPGGGRLAPFTLSHPQAKTLLLSLIPPGAVYISVDKDVLREEFAVTGWEQGKLRSGQLFELLATLAGYRRVVGADVCGDPQFAPWEGWWPERRRKLRESLRFNEEFFRLVIASAAHRKIS